MVVSSRCVSEVRARISALNRSGKLGTLEFKQGQRQEQRERDLKIQFRVLEIIFVHYSKSLRLQNVFKIRLVQLVRFGDENKRLKICCPMVTLSTLGKLIK